ncbi:hypothetical protein BR93DRAFT_926768 [Coniochaeta sp. PMI_546]|nr:hypothetical protein BR93DRAFT_926768 [Coniochaeta sp. PMI_546]
MLVRSIFVHGFASVGSLDSSVSPQHDEANTAPTCVQRSLMNTSLAGQALYKSKGRKMPRCKTAGAKRHDGNCTTSV